MFGLLQNNIIIGLNSKMSDTDETTEILGLLFVIKMIKGTRNIVEDNKSPSKPKFHKLQMLQQQLERKKEK